jgi:hypothetical protein
MSLLNNNSGISIAVASQRTEKASAFHELTLLFFHYPTQSM